MRIWKRDNQILNELEKTILSLSQIAKLFFPSKKKASERMTLLHRAGFVSRFHKPYIEERGRPEYIYCKKGRRPRSYGWIKHQLLTSELRMYVLEMLPKEFKIEFLYTSQMNREMFNGFFMPDASVIIEKGKKQLLYFLEIDCGTEQMKGGRYALQDKNVLYENYFDEGIYRQDFGEHFKGFRVLIVFESETRMKHFQEEQQNNFMYCTTWDSLTKGHWWVKQSKAHLI